MRPPYNVSVLTQAAAEHALAHVDVLEQQAERSSRERDALIASLRELRGVEVFPSEANFVLVRVPDAPRTDVAPEGARILVRNLHGCHPLLANCLRLTVGTPGENALLLSGLERVPLMRTATVTRNTNETQIRVTLNLDGTGAANLATGVPLPRPHARPGRAPRHDRSRRSQAEGDLHIDAHHTVEDIGITLGQAFAQAVGDKKGIRRYGHAYVPLDEALSRVVVDFSGRPGLEFHVPFTRALIGEFDVDLVHEFFQGFVNHAR